MGQSERFSATVDAILMNLANTGRSRKQALTIAADTVVVIFSLWLAYSLRLGQSFSDFNTTWYLFLVMPVATVATFSGLGIYRWVIRSTNQRLFRQLVKGSIVSALMLVMLTYVFPPDRANPRSLVVIYGILVLVGASGIRLIWQGIFDSGFKGQPIAVYGAGQGGQELASLLSTGNQYRPVVFLDDKVELAGSTLSGIPIVNPKNGDLKEQLRRYDVNRIVLAMPSLSGAGYRQKYEDLEPLGFPIQTMPGVGELITGRVRADEIRDISIKDILGRSEVSSDIELMSRRVTGRTVLVTGGGGSIGSELCRQIANLNPKKLLVLDSCEANLYYITEELTTAFAVNNGAKPEFFVPILGSVTERRWIYSIFTDHQIDTVFHAAAYKHVPIVEAQPDQGVKVNVFGTKNVLDAAVNHDVKDFVLISTDKAVRPTNAMGASKRVAELVLQAKASTSVKTRISMVRFGNVLGSSGSVVPKFKQQILDDGPITLTHSDVTRYFMTIPEAAQLVLQASSIAKGGDVFVLDMGEPVRIEDLATTMVHLYGKKLQRDTGDSSDIAIVVEGLRPGEKMYEELFINGSHQQTEVEKIFTAQEFSLDSGAVAERLLVLNEAIDSRDHKLLRRNLLQIASLGGRADVLETSNVVGIEKPDFSSSVSDAAVVSEV